jgi:hypothetical protein
MCSGQVQCDLQGLLDVLHCLRLKLSQPLEQAALGNSAHLTREHHRVLCKPTLWSVDSHIARVQLRHMSSICQGTDHNYRAVLIDCIPRDDHSWARAGLLRAFGGIKADKVDLTPPWQERCRGGSLLLHWRFNPSSNWRASQSERSNSWAIRSCSSIYRSSRAISANWTSIWASSRSFRNRSSASTMRRLRLRATPRLTNMSACSTRALGRSIVSRVRPSDAIVTSRSLCHADVIVRSAWGNCKQIHDRHIGAKEEP